MSLWLLVSAAGVVVLVVVVLAVFLPSRRSDIDTFAEARQLTNRWAENPESAPASIREMARRSAAGEDLVVPTQDRGRRPRPRAS
jgi:hypothetical protein